MIHIYYYSLTNINIKRDYLYYYLKFVLQQQLYGLQKGMAQQGVNKNDICQLQIYLPSLEKQKELVEKMDKYDSRIKETNKEIKELKDRQKTFMNNL